MQRLSQKWSTEKILGEENKNYCNHLDVSSILGGPRTCTFIADNLGGGEITRVKRWQSKETFSYDFKDIEKNIMFIAKLYKSCKESLKETASVPYTTMENETAIEARPKYDQETDSVWGYCGLKENHECREFYTISVGDDSQAYERLLERI